jgi:hypothetical protein
MRTLVLLMFLTLFTGCSQNSQDSPETLAAQYVAARQDYEWAKVSRLLHPESLEQFKDIMTKMNRSLDSVDLLTDQKIKSDSMLNFIRNEKSQALSPEIFFKDLMEKSLPTETMRSSNSHLIPILNSLGHVMEGSDTAHVVQRFYAIHNKDTINIVQLISLKRFSNTWKVLLPEELRSYMKMRLNTQRVW